MLKNENLRRQTEKYTIKWRVITSSEHTEKTMKPSGYNY